MILGDPLRAVEERRATPCAAMLLIDPEDGYVKDVPLKFASQSGYHSIVMANRQGEMAGAPRADLLFIPGLQSCVEISGDLLALRRR